VVELRTRAGERHPSVAEQRNVLDELKARLDAATARASFAIPTESRIAAERVGAVQAALNTQRVKVMQVKSKRDQARRLELDLELARKAYDAAVIHANEAVLETGASRGNVSMIKEAAIPSNPIFPKPMVNMVAAVVMGLLAAVAAAFWRESRDRRLRLEQDVYELLEQPLLGLISSGSTSTPIFMLSRR
jgi:succinoglycan biosynthesis transport protein ExoP